MLEIKISIAYDDLLVCDEIFVACMFLPAYTFCDRFYTFHDRFYTFLRPACESILGTVTCIIHLVCTENRVIAYKVLQIQNSDTNVVA